MKSRFHQLLEAQRDVVTQTEQDLATAKSYYSRSMANLEDISNEIHNRRMQNTKLNTDGESVVSLA